MIEQSDIDPLFRGSRDAEYELDLKGLDLPHATASVERMLERSRFRETRSVRIVIDAPDGEGGISHFQPLGRFLLDAKKAGILSAMTTLPPDDGLGFRIVTTGRVETDDADVVEDRPDL